MPRKTASFIYGYLDGYTVGFDIHKMSCPFDGLNEISVTFIKPKLRPNPIVGTKIVLYDEIIIWTSEHLTPTQLNEWHYFGDPVIDHFF